MPDERATERFGPIRASPPPLPTRPGWSGARWTAARLGDEGAYPNGGLWRFDSDAGSMIVKRTGAAHLGGDPIWRLSTDERDPQWWGREAAFYASDLAEAGWDERCTPAECLALDRRADEIDLWLEYVPEIPLPLERYPEAVRGLARWQRHHRDSRSDVLGRGWIARQLGCRRLDAAATLGHPGWPALLDAGLSEGVRRWAERRTTDAAVAGALLDGLPQAPTHHDFHNLNLGADGQRVVILDWATVGWGPIGHDVGNLVLDRASDGDVDVAELWEELLDAYGRELRSHGLDVDQATVRRSAAVSTVIRPGWLIDFLLRLGDDHDPSDLAGLVAVTNFLAGVALYLSTGGRRRRSGSCRRSGTRARRSASPSSAPASRARPAAR